MAQQHTDKDEGGCISKREAAAATSSARAGRSGVQTSMATMAANTRPGKAIGLFFFKGGVGKTTHTVNIAGALAHAGNRVVIVDFDPQCNTSQYFNTPDDDTDTAVDANQVFLAEEQAAATAVCQLAGGAGTLPVIEQDDATNVKEPHNMEAFVSEQRLGDELNVSVPFFKFFTEHDPWEPLVTEDEGAGLGIKRINSDFFSGGARGELYLVPGTPALTKYEQHLVDAVKNACHESAYCKNYGLCHRLLDLLRGKFDYVVVDMSPNAGALNQVMAMACDYLISPCQASVYSAGSMRALFETVYPAWFKRRKLIVKYQEESACTVANLRPYCIRPDPPKLFPILVGNYHILNDSRWRLRTTHMLARTSANFIMTIKSWLVELGNTTDPDKRAVLDAFALSPIDMIICFMMNSEMTVSACEEAGRLVIEMTPELYKAEYNLTVAKGKSKKRKRADAAAAGAEEIITEEHMAAFEWELEYCKRRYRVLAEWVIAYAGGARMQ